MMTTRTSSSLRSLAKPRSNNNNDAYDYNDDDKDVVIARASKNNDNHNVVFVAAVVVAVPAADEGVIRPCRCPLTTTPLHRKRSGDPSSSKLWSTKDNKDNNALIASASKNQEDHVRSLLGLPMMVESPAQPEAVACQEAAPCTRGHKVEVEAKTTRCNGTTCRCKQSGGARMDM